MNAGNRNRLLFGVMVIFIFAVYKIYNLTLNDAKMNHQLQQMEMVKAASTGMSYFLEHLAEDMNVLNFYPGFSPG